VGSKGEIILLSRVFLEACLEERLSQENPIVLDSGQREFLELVAGSATFSTDVIAVPKELLEAFLQEGGSLFASKYGNISDLGGE
jgi:hypothetical protein